MARAVKNARANVDLSGIVFTRYGHAVPTEGIPPVLSLTARGRRPLLRVLRRSKRGPKRSPRSARVRLVCPRYVFRVSERARTTGELPLFAEHIRKRDDLDRRHDVARTDRQPLPCPDLKMMQCPNGPGAVFGESNFPLASSTAGGDTAATLAAGCPVVVKGHSAQPGTGQIVAEAIHSAIGKRGVHPGALSLIQGGKRDVGQTLVQHPLIKAASFTGSPGGRRALLDLCAQIGTGWAGSLTVGTGHFCTNPGIAVVPSGTEGDAFVQAAAEALKGVQTQRMLTDGVGSADRAGKEQIDTRKAVRPVLVTEREGCNASPNLYEADASDYLQDHTLG